tara:strand:- start:195 stop:521 length:327 start_codon:yes stop_codon:yes gene_type:complete
MKKDNIYMNNDEKMRLAEYIADLVVNRLNSQFDFKIAEERGIDNSTELLIDDLLNDKTSISDDIEEHLIAELARLTTLLTIYEDKEQYEKASIIKNKIRIINKKLDND